MSKQAYLILALLALVAWGLVSILQHPFQGSGPQVGDEAPNFELLLTTGEKITLKSFRGQAVLLNFWASWCGPCREEMPSLEKLYQKYQNQGFVLLGVSVDEEGLPAVKGFLEKVPLSFPIALDTDQKVAELYETSGIPESYFINPQGRVVSKVVGPQDYTQKVFQRKVERILPQ